MRNFLQDLNIVGATMIYRCFDVHEYCINDLLKYCDRVLIMLDNYDKATEEKVLEYQSSNRQIKVIYSKVPVSFGETEKGQVYSRFNRNQDIIREQILRELEEMNKEQKIDLLLFPDSDEIFNVELSQILTDFWNSNKTVIFTGFVSPFNDFKTIRVPSMYSHARIFKYRPDMTAIGMKSRCRYEPFLWSDSMKLHYCSFHLAYLTKENRASRDFHRGTGNREAKIKNLKMNINIYLSNKDIRIMTRKELNVLLKRKPDYNFGEYLDKFNIEY